MNTPTADKEYFECGCSFPGHVITFEYNDEENEIYVSMQSRIWQGFFKRLRMALRFLFKKEEMSWDSTIVRPEDVPRMRRMLDRVK